MKFLIGTYTKSKESKGIYTVDLDQETGKLSVTDICEDCEDPSFITVNGKNVYAVQEVSGKGSIVTYQMDETGHLEKKHVLDMPGGLMCHLMLWPGKKYLSAANYGAGSLNVCKIDEDGVIRTMVGQKQYEGHGTHPQRQQGPHTHSSKVDPSGKWLVVAELGLDRIYIYEMDQETGELKPSAAMPYAEAPAGCGPRHFAFHPNGKKVYVSGELQSVVLVYAFDPETGVMTLEQTLTTLPETFKEKNLTAEIQVSKDARFVYVSNRGYDSIAVYKIGECEKLTPVGIYDCYGQGPRGFLLVGGSLILIANQVTGNLLSCRLDPETGALLDKLDEIEIPKAIWIQPTC